MVKHGVFDQMAQLVDVLVIRALKETILFGRDDGIHALAGGMFEDGIGIVTAVGQKIVGLQAGKERFRVRAIRSGTCCNKNSERHTMRIHGQMYLGVEPPFVWFMA